MLGKFTVPCFWKTRYFVIWCFFFRVKSRYLSKGNGSTDLLLIIHNPKSIVTDPVNLFVLIPRGHSNHRTSSIELEERRMRYGGIRGGCDYRLICRRRRVSTMRSIVRWCRLQRLLLLRWGMEGRLMYYGIRWGENIRKFTYWMRTIIFFVFPSVFVLNNVYTKLCIVQMFCFLSN